MSKIFGSSSKSGKVFSNSGGGKIFGSSSKSGKVFSNSGGGKIFGSSSKGFNLMGGNSFGKSSSSFSLMGGVATGMGNISNMSSKQSGFKFKKLGSRKSSKKSTKGSVRNFFKRLFTKEEKGIIEEKKEEKTNIENEGKEVKVESNREDNVNNTNHKKKTFKELTGEELEKKAD